MYDQCVVFSLVQLDTLRSIYMYLVKCPVIFICTMVFFFLSIF